MGLRADPQVTAMRGAFDDCIFCGADNGSAEHTILAALGGLRTDRGILCGNCNGGFSALDASLADDMRPLNAVVGVHHGRPKDANLVRLPVRLLNVQKGRVSVHAVLRAWPHLDALLARDTPMEQRTVARALVSPLPPEHVSRPESKSKQAATFVQSFPAPRTQL